MAQHDYVIDNSTGANVRADINSVLQAIASNNSGSSAPSTTYSFQLFADTTNNVMKIRNAANNAFIELFQLDGTFTLEDGSASTPALAARNDLNTGVFFSAADKFNIATGGVERLELGTTTIFNDGGNDVDFVIEGDSDTVLFYVDAGNNRIGINESSPDRKLTIRDGSFPAVRLKNSSTSISNGTLIGGFEFSHLDSSSSGLAAGILAEMANTSTGALNLVFKTGTGTSTYAETMRLTKDGHLIVGANADIHTGEGAEIQSVSTVGAGITLARNDTTVSSGSNLGIIRVYGNDADGTFQECAKIEFQADLNHGTNDKPTAIVFSTTPDGASSPTEKFRVKSGGDCELADGNLVIGTAGHGIDFSATTNGGVSTPSEILGDYEIGTWTPVFRDGTSMTVNSATYVKVGHLVMLQAYIVTGTNTSSNSHIIDGLPYAARNGNNFFIGSAYMQGGEGSTTDHKFVQVSNNAATLQVLRTNGLNITLSSNSGGYVLFTVSYRAADGGS